MMPDVPKLPIVEGIPSALPVPAEVAAAPGVAFNPPPLEIFPQVMAKIDDALAALPAGKTGGLISVFEVTPEGVKRVNAAIVQKIEIPGLPDRFETDVSAWIAKSWNGPQPGLSYGVAWRTTW